MNEDILEAAKKFKQWKKSVSFRGTPIPDDFINEFKNLNDKYQDKNIYKKIGVSKYSWDKKVLEKVPTSHSTTQKKRPFVLLSDQTVNNDQPTPLMTLKLKNGTEITVFQ